MAKEKEEEMREMEGSEMEAGVASFENLPEKDKAYILGLMKLLHSKETSAKVVEILSSAPPEQSIPQAALLINGDFESRLEEKGQRPSLDTLFSAGAYLVSDLIEIGNAAGIFQIRLEEPEGERLFRGIMESTFQTYITKGLEDGTIDPVELQMKVEKIMPEDMKKQGLQYAEAEGVPEEPGQMAAMEVYASKRERRAAKKAQRGMMRGMK